MPPIQRSFTKKQFLMCRYRKEKMKKAVKISIVGIGIIICVIVCIILFNICNFWLTYIDETIISGEGYGFAIGDSKQQVFGKANKLYQDKKLFILYPSDHQGLGPHREFNFTEEEYELIKDRNLWDFHYPTGYFVDCIKLTFEQDKLVEIYRHRQKFELL